MKTARRYLATEIYRSSLVVLLALVGLFSFFSVVEDLDRVGRGSFKLYHLLMLEGLALPTRIYDILPIGLLIGAIVALAGLAQRQELVIFRVSGVSGMRLLGMLWVVTLPVVVLAIVLAEWVTPAAELRLSEAQLRLTGSVGKSSGMLRSGYWFRETNAEGQRIINIAALQADGGARGITIYDFTPEQRLASVTQADAGVFEQGRMTLRDATVHALDTRMREALNGGQAVAGSLARMERLAEVSFETTLTPERSFARVLTPERMSLRDLVDYVTYLDDNHLVSNRQRVALWRKLIYPFTLLAMISIAAPLAFMQTRQGGVGIKIFLGILLGVGFFMLNQLSLNIGMLNRWPPWVTAVAPNALALLGGLLAMLWLEYRPRRRSPVASPEAA